MYLAIDAALDGDRDMMVEAILADGALADPDRAAALADDLIAAQLEHLPRFRTGRRPSTVTAPVFA